MPCLCSPLVLPREFQAVSNPVTYSLSRVGGSGGKAVGYIRLKEFNSLAKPKIQDAIQDLEKQGTHPLDMVKGVVHEFGG